MIKVSTQTHLLNIIEQNTPLAEIIDTVQELNIPGLFVGAGAIAQTVWNYLHGYDLAKHISDIDIAYFDNTDLSYEAEAKVIEKIDRRYEHIPLKLDIKNQARVHLWYEDHFGEKIKPYKSIYDAIDTWPTTSTAIGIRKREDDYEVYTPFGLNDLLDMVVRPNKRQITKEIYERKVTRWKRCWPELKIVKW